MRQPRVRASGVGATRAAALLFLAAASAGVEAAEAPVPLPEMVVGRTAAPPKLDGKIEPGEWDRAAATTGFVKAFDGGLALVQTTARITYDDRYFYVAFTNYRGEQLRLLQKRGRRADDEAIVFDPANEVWITPPVAPGMPQATYQTLFNAYPAVLDVKMIPALGYTAKSWRGGWEIAVGETAEAWTVEARAPIAAFGAGDVKDGATWRALFTTDIFQDGNAFRAWAPGGAFADIPRHGFLHFRGGSAVFQLLDVETIFTGKPRLKMAVSGPPAGSAEVSVEVRFGAGVEAAEGDLVLKKQVRVAAGKHEEFALEADLASAKLGTRKVVVDATTKAERQCPAGYCTVVAKTADGTVLYRQVFPFAVNGLVRKPPATIESSPYKQAFGLEAFYAPLSKKLLVKIDRYYLAQRAAAVGGQVRLVDEAGKVLAERKLAAFRQDYSEFPVDLAKLDVPVETEADWAAGKPAREENQKIAAENKKRKAAGPPEGEAELPLKEVPGVKPRAGKLVATLTGADGAEIATASTDVALLGYQFEWLGNTLGFSDKAIPPWTPVTVAGDRVRVWGKEYQLDGLGLARQVVNQGAKQLSGPMRMTAVVDGKEVEMRGEAPAVKKATEAAVELEGRASGGGLAVRTASRVEFDGFVWNAMTVGPTAAKVERLSLEVNMPEAEAPAFVTTSGGWSAYHGWTPAKWDSREMALGSMVGNFVPYVFLTDSDRGFCLCADTEHGWRLDPAAPTIELRREGGEVRLRVHFITRAGPIAQPLKIEYGWMVTPQKPQPKGWRAYLIGNDKPAPQVTNVFWNDADWAVLWPYYSSPFPWDYAKSRAALAGAAQRGVVGCVGNIAHAIARYQDYKGRKFPAVGADWGSTPGDLSNGNVARSRGPNDFQIWHWDRWIEKAGLSGLYFDENYLAEDWNYLTGTAYLLDDERVQPGYGYLGLRAMNVRLRYLFHQHGKPLPNLWLHTTSGQPVYAWLPDVAMEGENVEPAGGENDYLEALPAARLRAIGMGRNLGAAPFVMCQAQRHWVDGTAPFLVRQFVGWVLLHDTLPEGVDFWSVLMPELEFWRDDIKFRPYWKAGQGIEVSGKDVLVSAHTRPGRGVLWVMNTAREERKASVQVDLGKIGMEAGKPVAAYDLETGEPYAVAGGKLEVTLPKRDWRAVCLVQPTMLTGRQSLVAHFDEAVRADEALGNAYPRNPRPRGADAGEALVAGKTGKALGLDQAVAFAARQHVTAARGEVEFELQIDPAKSSGTLLTVGPLRVQVGRGKVTVSEARKVAAPIGEGALTGAAGWHAVRVAWEKEAVEVAVDGKVVAAGRLAAALPIPTGARGVEIKGYRPRVEPAWVEFGPVKGAALDDLVMGK